MSEEAIHEEQETVTVEGEELRDVQAETVHMYQSAARTITAEDCQSCGIHVDAWTLRG